MTRLFVHDRALLKRGLGKRASNSRVASRAHCIYRRTDRQSIVEDWGTEVRQSEGRKGKGGQTRKRKNEWIRKREGRKEGRREGE